MRPPIELTLTIRPCPARRAGRNAWVTAFPTTHAGAHLEAELREVPRGGLTDPAGRSCNDDGSTRHGREPSLRCASVGRVDVEEAIRGRRTHKAFGQEPVDPATLDELLELACWAPNHNVTNPWRFRVLGPEALDRLKAAAGPEGAAKLDRAPTLVTASVIQCGDELQNQEDMCAAAAAVYIVLLAAHARGLVGYWRTPAVLRSRQGRAAVGIGDGERVLGLINLGPPRQDKEPPERLPPRQYVTYLA